MISLLVTARQDSKYLAKFVMTYIAHTKGMNTELLIFLDPEDTWNKELLEYICGNFLTIRVIDDTTGIGRGGSHIFYNEVAKEALGDWLWYLCDDHYLYEGFDEYISDYILKNNLDPEKVNVIAPMCDNSGRISHILSRKTFETIGFGQHGNVDSYINETLERLDELKGYNIQPHVPPVVVMSDLGIDKDLMKHKNRDDFDPVQQAELFKSEGMKEKIKEDAKKLYDVL